MSVYKQRHLDDTDEPQDVGLSSEDEIAGMAEQVGVSRRILTQLPGAPTSSRGMAPSPAPEGEPYGDPAPTPQSSLPEGCETGAGQGCHLQRHPEGHQEGGRVGP